MHGYWVDTNLLFPPLHDKFNPIDTYCHAIQQTQIFIFHTVKCGIWIFSSLRLILSVYQFSIFGEEGIFYASDNHKYKFCWMFTDNIEMDTIWIIVFITNEWIINIGLLFILYRKTKKLERYQRDNQHLSPHFSQRDNILQMVNTKTMRRCIFGGLTAMIINVIGIGIYVVFHTNCLLGIGLIGTGLPVISTFDIKLEDICFGMNDDNNMANVAPAARNGDNEQGFGIELTEHQQQYLARIMAAYNKVPARCLVAGSMVATPIQIEGH